jgi:hypothetical protein
VSLLGPKASFTLGFAVPGLVVADLFFVVTAGLGLVAVEALAAGPLGFAGGALGGAGALGFFGLMLGGRE